MKPLKNGFFSAVSLMPACFIAVAGFANTGFAKSPAKAKKEQLSETDRIFNRLSLEVEADSKTLKQKKVFNVDGPSKVELKAVELPFVKTKDESPLDVKPVTKYSESELKTLEAIILHEIRKEHEIALGIMAEVLNKTKTAETYYHYARMALKVGLPIEYRKKMLLSLTHKNAGAYKDLALKDLLLNAQALEVEDVGAIDPYAQSANGVFETHPYYHLILAKHLNQVGELKRAIAALDKVDTLSPFYIESLFLHGVIDYKMGQLDRAITELEKIMDLTGKEPKNNLRALAAITLGRMYFQKAEFKKSFESYRKVDRHHALWFEAMSEQAWSQILVKDYEGAAGNMFSLHTDYFKNVYAPETFLIRSVGYLNLCQYGDGMKVLVELGKKYFPMKSKISKFNKEKRETTALYEMLKLWARNPDLQEIEGVPSALIVQAGRDPGFIGYQKKINQREDEIGHFNKLFLELIQGERAALQSENKDLQNLYRSARSSLRYVRTNTIQSLNDEISQLKKEAAGALNQRFQRMTAQLDKIIDEHEILYYEVYSGAGEHLRYQNAGGTQTNKEIRPEMKGEKGKTMVWNFKGEIWEDEIGNYRSSLKNICPEEERKMASESKGE